MAEMEKKKKNIRETGVKMAVNGAIGAAIEWAYIEGFKDGLAYCEKTEQEIKQEEKVK